MKYPVSRPSLNGTEMIHLAECIQANWLTHGPKVEEFEARFAAFVGAKYAIACTSGTTALHLALVAAGVGKGNEVLVPNLSFVATANAVAYTGATPVLVDVDPLTWCMDVDAAEQAITPNTVGILPVHLFGNAANMFGFRRLAQKYGLFIIEDAAEGLGGKYESRHLGTLSLAGCYSFYGNKVLTTGEGGMVVTDDRALYEKLYLYRGQGQTTRYMHTVLGFNYRMTAMQAAIGLGQLEHLPEALDARRLIFTQYERAFTDTQFQVPTQNAAPWQYAVVLPDQLPRCEVEKFAASRGIETRPFFVPMNQLPMYKMPDVLFPHSTRLGMQGIVLPTYVGLSQADVRFIAQAVQLVAVGVDHARM